MKRYLSIYRLFLAQHFKTLMEYRINFLIGMCSTVALQGASIMTLWIVMSRIPDLNGWTLSEILLIYGLVALGLSLQHMFADNLWTLGRAYIQPGGFDRFLVRPLDPLFHLLADRFCEDGIGDFIVGIVLVVLGGRGAGVHWTPLNLVVLVLAVLSGAAIFFSINLLLGTSAFWVMDSVPIILAVQQTNQFARYPLSIYNKAVTVVMTWVIPYGLAAFYPAEFILGRNVSYMAFMAVPVSAVLLVIAYRVWLFGLAHYGGTGS